MDKAPGIKHTQQISRDEILYLMNLFGAKNLFGVDQKEIEAGLVSIVRQSDPKSIAGNLVKKGVLVRKGKVEFTPSPHMQPILDTLFNPVTGLAILLDKPGIGKKIFFMVRKEKNIVFHSSLSEDEHFIALVSQPEDVETILAESFPFSEIPVSPVKFRIKRKIFEYIQFITQAGKTDEARSLMSRGDLDPAEQENFLRAIMDRKISGSIALLFLQGDTVREAKSVFLQSDGRTAWLVSPMESDSEENQLLFIRRTGSDFSSTLRQIVEEFSGVRFPRKQLDPSGKLIRFVLSVDELAFSLHAINCPDQSRKIYLLGSGDAAGGRYAGTMKQAQQSLVESELCAVSERGLPVLNEELAQAVFPVGKSDSMIKISGSIGGPALETGVYIVQGRFFTIYRNYGEQLQILESGKYEHLSSSVESMFPDFGTEKNIQKSGFLITLEKLEGALEKISNLKEAVKILASDGVTASDAALIVDDLANPIFRALLIHRYPPDQKKKTAGRSLEKNEIKQSRFLMLLKSSKHSWLFTFPTAGEKGTASITDREGFHKAIAELIA